MTAPTLEDRILRDRYGMSETQFQDWASVLVVGPVYPNGRLRWAVYRRGDQKRDGMLLERFWLAVADTDEGASAAWMRLTREEALSAGDLGAGEGA